MHNTGRARRYKSRKARPCDLCRGRKTACHMETGPPCQLCYDRQRPCTFLQAPTKRSRPTTTLPCETSDSLKKEGGSRPAAGAIFLKHDSRVTCSDCPKSPARAEIFITRRSESIPRDSVITESLLQAPDINLNVDITDVERRAANNRSIDSTTDIYGTGLKWNLSQGDDTRPFQLSLISEPWSFQRQYVDVDGHASLDSKISKSVSNEGNNLAASSLASYPLDTSPGVSSRFIGPTGDLDPYILSYLTYDAHNESSPPHEGLHSRITSHPCHMPSASEAIPNSDPPVCTRRTTTNMSPLTLLPDVLESATQEFRTCVRPEAAFRLSLLYARYIHPHFPILSARQVPSNPEKAFSMPLALICAISGLAIPFIIHDDVLSLSPPQCSSPNTLFRLTWTFLTQEFETPRLSTILSCLLLLQAHTSNEYISVTPFRPALLNITVALCHSLGLHRDCSEWVYMPLWERRLRKRIWWGVWVMEKWISLGESVPSILSEENHGVQPLQDGDLDDGWSEYIEPLNTSTHFPHLVTLTEILRQVVSAFFTVRGTGNTATNIEKSLEIAKPLRAMLKEWHDSLPAHLKHRKSQTKNGQRDSNHDNARSPPIRDLHAHGTFYLAYITVQLTLFRALLRPVAHMSLNYPPSKSGNVDEFGMGDSYNRTAGPSAIIRGAMVVIKEVILFVESLEVSDWEAFWHSWSRTNFAIVSCVMLNLLMILRPSIPAQPIVSPSSHDELDPEADGVCADSRLSWDTSSLPNVGSDYITMLQFAKRWRLAIKGASSGATGKKGLVNLSLLRMDALLAELHESAAVD